MYAAPAQGWDKNSALVGKFSAHVACARDVFFVRECLPWLSSLKGKAKCLLCELTKAHLAPNGRDSHHENEGFDIRLTRALPNVAPPCWQLTAVCAVESSGRGST